MAFVVHTRPQCGISRASLGSSGVPPRRPHRSASRLVPPGAASSSGHVRSGGRMAKDLQQAENEARGEIIELNSGMDRIANVANSAAEKEASTSNRFAANDHSSSDNNSRNGSTTSASARAEPVPPLKKPAKPAEGFEQPLAHSDDHSEESGKAGSSGGKKGEDVKGAMLKPSSVNSPWVRLLTLAGAVVLASRGTALLSRHAAAFVYVLAYGTWTGANLWTTFIGGITMFKALPRQVFGRLQAKLFPPYFQLQAVCIGLLMGSLMLSAAGLARSQALILGSSLVTTLLNLVIAEPTATRLMLERYELENADKRDESRIKPLYKKFSMWHGISSSLNLVATVGAVAHGWWLAGRMVAPVV